MSLSSTLYGERVATVFFDKPRRLLSIENVELGAQVREAKGGELRNRQYGPDEGPAFQTYLMFLEDNVVGMVRLDRGPYAKQASSAIEVLTGYGLELTHLVDPKVNRRVERHATADWSKLKFKAIRGGGAEIKKATKLGDIFAAADEVFPHGHDFTFIASVVDERERQRFGTGSKSIIDKIINNEEVRDLFEEAEIGLVQGAAIDLLEQTFFWKGSVETDERRHIDEATISDAIQSAYADERAAILETIGAA